MSVSAKNIILSGAGGSYWINELTFQSSGDDLRPRDVSAIDTSNNRISLVVGGGAATNGELDVNYASGSAIPGSGFTYGTFGTGLTNNETGVRAAPLFYNSGGGASSSYIVGDLQWDVNNPNVVSSEVYSDANADSSLAAYLWFGNSNTYSGLSVYDVGAGTLKSVGVPFEPIAVSFKGSDVFTCVYVGGVIYVRAYPVAGGSYTQYTATPQSLATIDDDSIYFIEGSSNSVTVSKLNTANTSLGWTRTFSISSSSDLEMTGSILNNATTVDASGDLYVIGSFNDKTSTINDGVYILKIDSDGEAQWCNYIYSSSGNVSPSCINHDQEDSLIVGVSNNLFKLPDFGELTGRGPYFGHLYYEGPLSITQGTKTSGYNPSTTTTSFSWTSNTGSALTPNSEQETSFTAVDDLEEM